MAITTGNYQKDLKPIVKNRFGDSYKEYELLYKKYMELEMSEDAYEEDILNSGFSLAAAKSEGSAVRYEDTSQGYTARYDMIMYAKGFSISREAMEDGKAVSRAMKLSKSLKRSMLQTSDVVSANILNRAFDANYIGGDGSELCATDHETLAEDLVNELSTPADLSEGALEDITIAIDKFKDNKGLRMRAKPVRLVVPPDLQFQAERILESALRVETADNDLNAIKNKGIFAGGTIVNPYLTDDNNFFVLTDVEHGLKFMERTALRMEDDNDFDTFNAKFIASHRYAVGWTDPRGIYGSAPA